MICLSFFCNVFLFCDVLGGIFGGHIRPCISHVCCYLVDMRDLIIISFHECQFDLFACLVHHFHTRTCCSAKFPLQIGSVFSIPPSPQTFCFFFFGWLQSLSSSCFPSLEASLLTFRNGINYREAMNDQGKWKKFMATWQGTGSIPDLWSVASGYISKMFQTSGTQQHQKACQQRNTEMYDDVI